MSLSQGVPQWSWSTSAQLMACCLMSPSNFLNWFWLIIHTILSITSQCTFCGNALYILQTYKLKIILFQWQCSANLKLYILCVDNEDNILLLKSEYLVVTRSVPWLLMPWLHMPGHHQLWSGYYLCRIKRPLSFTNKDFHLSVVKW